MKVSSAFLAVMLIAGCASLPLATHNPAAVQAVDEQQRAMVARGDVNGLEQLAHPNLRINAPTGRVLTRAHFLINMRNGEIAAEQFERTTEEVRLTGNTAVVMGREVFGPLATSELGRTFGARSLQQRYTNVYLWEDGRWQWVARHANVIPLPAGSSAVSWMSAFQP